MDYDKRTKMLWALVATFSANNILIMIGRILRHMTEYEKVLFYYTYRIRKI